MSFKITPREPVTAYTDDEGTDVAIVTRGKAKAKKQTASKTDGVKGSRRSVRLSTKNAKGKGNVSVSFMPPRKNTGSSSFAGNALVLLDYDRLANKTKDARYARYTQVIENIVIDIEKKLDEFRSIHKTIAEIEYRIGKKQGREQAYTEALAVEVDEDEAQSDGKQ